MVNVISSPLGFISGTLVYNKTGKVISIITQRKGDLYAIGGNVIPNSEWEFTATCCPVQEIVTSSFNGTFNCGVFNGAIFDLNKNKQKWNKLTCGECISSGQRNHIVGRRFGGPARDYNCGHTPNESDWTLCENLVSDFISGNMFADVLLDVNKGLYNITVKHEGQEVEFCYDHNETVANVLSFQTIVLIVERNCMI